jgi:hypothetical protein
MNDELIFCEECGDAPAVECGDWICCGCCGAQISRLTPLPLDAAEKPAGDGQAVDAAQVKPDC